MLALAFITLALPDSALITGVWCVVLKGLPGEPASAGAARTETASSAAEMVLSIIVLLLKGPVRSPVDVAGLTDHVAKPRRAALNPR